MSRFVMDASIAVAWAFSDEKTALTDLVLESLARGGSALVPDLWGLEVANALWMAEGRKGISSSARIQHQEMLLMLPLETRRIPVGRAFEVVSALASTQQLTVYDATYLDLAQREGLPLATLDKQLSAAAKKMKVRLFG